MIKQTVLKPGSYREMEREIVLKNGVGTRYGLGVGVSSFEGHRVLSHGGEVSGFTAENMVLPDDGIAIVVQTNQDAVGASGEIATQVRAALLRQNNPEDQRQSEIVRSIYDGLQQGKIDRSLFTDNCNFYFSEQAIKDYADSLGPLGKPDSFVQTGTGLRGGMTFRAFEVSYPGKKLEIITYQLPDRSSSSSWWRRRSRPMASFATRSHNPGQVSAWGSAPIACRLSGATITGHPDTFLPKVCPSRLV